MTTRSDCLARGVVSAGASSIVFTSPPGFTTIVKDLVLTQAFASGATTAVYVLTAGGGDYALLGQFPSLENGTVDHACWVVLRANDELRIDAQSNDTHYWVSGAVLPYP